MGYEATKIDFNFTNILSRKLQSPYNSFPVNGSECFFFLVVEAPSLQGNTKFHERSNVEETSRY